MLLFEPADARLMHQSPHLIISNLPWKKVPWPLQCITGTPSTTVVAFKNKPKLKMVTIGWAWQFEKAFWVTGFLGVNKGGDQPDWSDWPNLSSIFTSSLHGKRQCAGSGTQLGVASELQSVSRRDCKKIGQSTIGGLLTYYMWKYNY